LPANTSRFYMKLRPASALTGAGFPFLSLMLLSSVAAQSSTSAEKPEFRQLVPEGAAVEKLAGGFEFTEGPAWNPVQGFLLFSDIPASRLYRYDAAERKAGVFREPSEHANGNFYDSAGVLYTCEHGARRVSRQRTDGQVEVLVDRYGGKLFSSPNDIVVKHDGTVWFTDPTYGLAGRPKEQATNNVYCFDPKTRALRVVVSDFDQPNGLCFSPDEARLYIADSGQPRHVRVFDVSADNCLSRDRVFCAIGQGVPDGMRCDRQGDLLSTSQDSIQVFNPAGELLGKIPVPETPANLCFGGPAWNDLYITARTSLYHIKLTTAAAGK
jgi:gluconolactonase